MELDLILILILAATFATAFLSSIFGMLGGLILMGILISFLSVGPAMVLHGLIQATSNGYRAWLNRNDIDWKIVITLMLGSTISLIVLFFIAFEPSQILVIFALGLLPYIAWAVPKELSLDITKPQGTYSALVQTVDKLQTLDKDSSVNFSSSNDHIFLGHQLLFLIVQSHLNNSTKVSLSDLDLNMEILAKSDNLYA